MKDSKSNLFKGRRFLPLFITQFCGCLNDNLLKNALIILVTYRLASSLTISPEFIILLANGIFTLPFMIFAGLAGQLSDKYEKAYVIRIVKYSELFIIALAIYGFYETSIIILLSSIGLMGIHSTFFGPVKYSILPDHLDKNELLPANGYIEGATFLSILLGTLLGGLYDAMPFLVIFLMVFVAITGLVSSYYIPVSDNYNSTLEINKNFIKESINIVVDASSKKMVFLSILGISWFWFIGAALISQIPILAKNIFYADYNVANLFLATFSVGVGLGSYLCNRFLASEITTKYLFISAIGISVFCFDLYFASIVCAEACEPSSLRSILVFISSIKNWRIIIDLFLISAIGGMYVVPLYAVMQHYSAPSYRSRVIAANNVINSIFMVSSSLLLSLLFKLQFTVPKIILLVSIMNVGVSIYIYKKLPQVKIIPDCITTFIFKFIFDCLYKVEVKGIENYYNAGERVVVVANHLSFLDPAIIAAYLPERPVFAIHTDTAAHWWVKPFLKLVSTYQIDTNNSMSTKALIKELKKGKKIGIFPEGRISTTGSLMKIYEGPAMIADKADAVILPVRIDGTQYTHFSKSKLLSRQKIFSKVTLTVLPPVKLTAQASLFGRERRKHIGEKLYDIMSKMLFESSNLDESLLSTLVSTAQVVGYKKTILRDIDNSKSSYKKLLKEIILLSEVIDNYVYEETVGLLLPNYNISVTMFFGAQLSGRIPVMFSSDMSFDEIVNCMEKSSVKTIFSSRRFIEAAGIEEMVSLIEKKYRLIFLEDIREKIGISTYIKVSFLSIFANSYIAKKDKNNNLDIGAIIFTAGQETDRKMIKLKNSNILANRFQMSARIDFNPHDIIFSALPFSTGIGLSSIMIGILNGVETFIYPSSYHMRVIPELVYMEDITIIFSTNKFLKSYAESAHPYDFFSVRYIFSGVDKLDEENRKIWLEKYGVRILEYYSLSEGAGVIACNTSMHNKKYTQGRLLPEIDYKLEKIELINNDNAGRLFIRGPNINCFNNEINMSDNYIDTGDVVEIDEDGYLKFISKFSRLIKIEDKYYNLDVIEDKISNLYKLYKHAVIKISGDVILYTNYKALNLEMLKDKLSQDMGDDLIIPSKIEIIDDISFDMLGKKNYRNLNIK